MRAGKREIEKIYLSDALRKKGIYRADAPADEYTKMKAQWAAESDPSWKEVKQTIDTTMTVFENCSHVVDERRAQLKLFAPVNQAFQDLLQQAQVSHTTTDSDGKFQMTVPASGKFFLWATVTREIGDKKELFVWLVPLTNEKAQKVTLSNNNNARSGVVDF